MTESKEMKKLKELAKKQNLNYDNVFYMGMSISKMSIAQLRVCLAHSIGLNMAYGAIDSKGKANLPNKK